jgi:DNA-binding MurR/RpiR family transcriptional regulator
MFTRSSGVSIQDLIANAGDSLTPTERRIAEAVLEDQTLIAFGTVSDLAARVGTSRPSIVRFAFKLGLGGYPDLQRLARDGVARRLQTPSERIRRQTGEWAGIHRDIEQSVHWTIESLDASKLRALAGPIVAGRCVWVVSGETSRAGAIVLHSGLSMVRGDVRLLEEHDLGRDLCSVEKGDAAVVFDFARYRRAALHFAEAIGDLGADLVAITDGPLSPLVPLATEWCELKVPAVGPFDSSLPAVLAAELIVIEVVRQLGADARERIDRLEAHWAATNTFVADERAGAHPAPTP